MQLFEHYKKNIGEEKMSVFSKAYSRFRKYKWDKKIDTLKNGGAEIGKKSHGFLMILSLIHQDHTYYI